GSKTRVPLQGASSFKFFKGNTSSRKHDKSGGFKGSWECNKQEESSSPSWPTKKNNMLDTEKFLIQGNQVEKLIPPLPPKE
ncbi:hypothetical protein HAX54_014298, partial [Datura stramonium]|nr:hypothetical protein [Datura stramonium]